MSAYLEVLKEPCVKFKEYKTEIYGKLNQLELAKSLILKDKSEITDPTILSWWTIVEEVWNFSLVLC